MENMIKVRAMRAAGIACFFDARDYWCMDFLPRQAVILLTLLLKQEKWWEEVPLTGPLC